MVSLTIDGKNARVPVGTTILDAAASVGVSIPTLCWLRDLNEVGACRVCVVEVAGEDKLSAACNTVVQDGMTVLTKSERAMKTRKINTQLILAGHDCKCPTCVRNGSCSLQTLASDLNILSAPYEKRALNFKWNKDYPLIRDDSLCINCMRCISVCSKVQSLGVWGLHGAGSHISVNVIDGGKIENSPCALCGQCVTHCPVGALYARDDTMRVLSAINDPGTTVMFQIAPAVRAAWGEGLGLSREAATVGRLAATVRALGADYVFDTNFAADLTIMEEGSELLGRIGKRDKHPWPMFTSCCPGWVRFLKSQYPELIDNLSTAKSPQQMFGAAAKTWFAERNKLDPGKLFCVSVMPCVAKKHESALPVMNDAGAGQDVDAVLTSRELIRLIRMLRVDAAKLPEEPFDDIMGVGTGAAVIFGATGGVMEAALRSAYFLATGEKPDADAFSPVRGNEGVREATVMFGATPVRAAVASGLGNARRLIESIKSGEAEYDFVEIMACPGGCVGGGGQPISDGEELAPERAPVLYDLDKRSVLRFSHENPAVLTAYEEYFEKPLSHKSHKLLHTDHNAWKMPNE